MVRNAERIACVRSLRALALRCGVERVRDCAGKEAVEAMMARIRASDGDGLVEARAEAEAEFKRFLATYQEQAVEQGPAEVEHRSDPATEKKRLRGTSFLFTYNWRYMNKALPDQTPALADASALWRSWREWKKAKKVELNVKRSTSAIEKSLDSPDPGRVHIHWKVDLKASIDHKDAAAFRFHGIWPDVRKTIVARMVELSGCLFLQHQQELEVMKYISFRVPRPGDWRCRRSSAPPAPQPPR